MSSPSLKKRKLELAAAVTPIVLLAFVSEDGIPSCYAVPVASLFRPLDEIKAQLKLAPNKWDCYIPSTCEITDDVLNKETASLEQVQRSHQVRKQDWIRAGRRSSDRVRSSGVRLELDTRKLGVKKLSRIL